MPFNIPQTGRQPFPLDEEEVRTLLRRRHRSDTLDPFATDPDATISELGRLALRRNDINDLFALGDLCARKTWTEDQQLHIIYASKALTGYRRAGAAALNDIDRQQAQHIVEAFASWVVACAQRAPTPRNLAVALWVITEDDKPNGFSARIAPATVHNLLDRYRRQSIDADDDRLTFNDEQTHAFSAPNDDDGTQADISLNVLSDDSITVADLGIEEDAFSRTEITGFDFIKETFVEDSQPSLQPVRREADNSDPSVQHRRNQRTDQAKVSEFNIGDRIDGIYEVIDIRWGGMGVVYLCYDHDKREPVAIKSFQMRYLHHERAISRFTNEALTWIRLDKHRHIVHAQLVRNVNNRPHIFLEHISGQERVGSDLRSWIDHRRIDTPKAIEFGLHIALGMMHATSRVIGLVHRDLKPANILVTHDGVAKVTDFGLVRSVRGDEDSDIHESSVGDDSESHDSLSDSKSRERITRFGTVVGTAPYLSPEQCRAKDVDMRSDIYAFGCVLYEMLTGRQLFHARRLEEWQHAHIHEIPTFDNRNAQRLPRRLQALTLACLEKDPQKRPQTWAEIVDLLTELYQETGGEPLDLEITGPALQARELMDKGYSLTELHRLDEALEAYDQAIKLQPDYAWAWARKGRTLRLLGRFDAALACYNKALELEPKYAWAWNGKGIILERIKQFEAALSCFEMATELNHNEVWYWYNRADVLQNLERYHEAIPLLENGLQLDPAHANSWAKLGQIYRLLNHFEEAITAYEEAIRLDDDYAWAHNGCGLALKALGRTRDALMYFRRAATHQPNDVLHWYNLTEALVDLGEYEEAITPAREATRTDPNHAFSWAKLGQVMRYVGNYEEALTAYDRAIQLEPDSAWAINGRGIVLEQMEAYQDALDCYYRASELKPNDVWHWYNQGNVLVLMSRYEEAYYALQQATQINRQHARSWARMATALRHLNRLDEALQACEQANRLAPAQPWVWSEQGNTLEAMNRLDEALQAFEHAASLAPNELFYLYKQTDILSALGKHQQAFELLENALKGNLSGNTQIWAKRGQVLRRLNRLQEALESYNQAINLDPENDWSWSGRGLTLSALNQHEEALRSFEKAIELKQDDAWYWYNHADELLSLNKIQEALKSLEKALEINPRHAESWANQGQALRRLRDYEGAILAYDRSVSINPRYAWAWNGRGLTFKEMGRKEEALASYERAAREEPANVWYTINQADILLELQRRQEALNVIETAISIAPKMGHTWARKGQVLRRMRRFEEAIEAYTQALTLDPRYAWAWNGKGLCLFSLDRWEEALYCYQQAVHYDGSDLWFWHNCGETYMRLGDYQQSEQMFLRALEIYSDHAPSKEKLAEVRKKLKQLRGKTDEL